MHPAVCIYIVFNNEKKKRNPFNETLEPINSPFSPKKNKKKSI